MTSLLEPLSRIGGSEEAKTLITKLFRTGQTVEGHHHSVVGREGRKRQPGFERQPVGTKLAAVLFPRRIAVGPVPLIRMAAVLTRFPV
jgi:hypothetical protein